MNTDIRIMSNSFINLFGRVNKFLLGYVSYCKDKNTLGYKNGNKTNFGRQNDKKNAVDNSITCYDDMDEANINENNNACDDDSNSIVQMPNFEIKYMNDLSSSQVKCDDNASGDSITSYNLNATLYGVDNTWSNSSLLNSNVVNKLNVTPYRKDKMNVGSKAEEFSVINVVLNRKKKNKNTENFIIS
ncbi:hypothetical protein AVEN_185378-1 [Araneus ventricosus]|uniref:Uncharacterized protein n=1 Tax=Araneus ventricosus TaxID=182803 RepID=A0A4Y2UDE2_ARAVE|nr:hypothetical protein AVEN_185378-1 [Araneus ventricosus]